MFMVCAQDYIRVAKNKNMFAFQAIATSQSVQVLEIASKMWALPRRVWKENR